MEALTTLPPPAPAGSAAPAAAGTAGAPSPFAALLDGLLPDADAPTPAVPGVALAEGEGCEIESLETDDDPLAAGTGEAPWCELPADPALAAQLAWNAAPVVARLDPAAAAAEPAAAKPQGLSTRKVPPPVTTAGSATSASQVDVRAMPGADAFPMPATSGDGLAAPKAHSPAHAPANGGASADRHAAPAPALPVAATPIVLPVAADALAAVEPKRARMADTPDALSATPAMTTGLREARLESSFAATAATATVRAPVDSDAFAPELAMRVSLLARDGVQRAELRLNPAELGPVAVQIVIDGTNARVDFGAEAAATRHALESSLPALAASLRESGLVLAGGGISAQIDAQTQQHAAAQSHQRDGSQGSPRGAAAEAGGLPEKRGRDAVAAPPQIRRVRAGGVDLYA